MVLGVVVLGLDPRKKAPDTLQTFKIVCGPYLDNRFYKMAKLLLLLRFQLFPFALGLKVLFNVESCCGTTPARSNSDSS